MTRPASSVLSVAGALLLASLGFFLWSLWRDLGSLIPPIAAILLVWPHRRRRWAMHVLKFVVALGAVWILHKARMVVYPLLFALLVAYWLDPAVRRLEQRRVRRPVGSAIVLLPFLGLLALFAIVVLPIFIDQLLQLVSAVPAAFRGLYDHFRGRIEPYLPGGKKPDIGQWIAPLWSHLVSLVRTLPSQAGGISRGIGTIVGYLGTVLLTPVLAFYILLDFGAVRTWTVSFLSRNGNPATLRVVQEIGASVNAYFRGQVLVSLCIWILLSAGFAIIGLPYAFLLGFLGGLLNLVPVIGFWITVSLCVPAALLSGEPGAMLLRLAIVFAVSSVLEGQVITPRIVGKAVGLNPALILLAVLGFGAILGPVGVIVAVPAAAAIKIILEHRSGHAAPGPVTRNEGAGTPGRPTA